MGATAYVSRLLDVGLSQVPPIGLINDAFGLITAFILAG